jgi:hypothetical protein
MVSFMSIGMAGEPRGVHGKRHPHREMVSRAYTAVCLIVGAGALYAGMETIAAILLLGVLLHWAAVHSQR